MWWPVTCHGQFCWKLTDCNHWAVDCCLSFQNCKWNLHFAQVSLKIFDLIYCLKRPNPQFSNLQSRVHQDSPETHSKSSTWNQCQWSWRAGWARFRVNHEWQSLDMLDHVVSAGHPAPVVTPENWKWPHWTQTVFFFFFFFLHSSAETSWPAFCTTLPPLCSMNLLWAWQCGFLCRRLEYKCGCCAES